MMTNWWACAPVAWQKAAINAGAAVKALITRLSGEFLYHFVRTIATDCTVRTGGPIGTGANKLAATGTVGTVRF